MINADTALTVTFIDAEGNRQVSEFSNYQDAWRFMRLCDVNGVSCGYPQLKN
jgi:hypothetical protein